MSTAPETAKMAPLAQAKDYATSKASTDSFRLSTPYNMKRAAVSHYIRMLSWTTLEAANNANSP